MDILRHIILPSPANGRSNADLATPLSCDGRSEDLRSGGRPPSEYDARDSILDFRRETDHSLGVTCRTNRGAPSNSEFDEGKTLATRHPHPDSMKAISTRGKEQSRGGLEKLPDGSRDYHETMKRLKPQRSNGVCFFWYNDKVCDRDPANPQKPGRVCPYLHKLDTSQPDLKIARFPPWMHPRDPCGLALYPRKDKGWMVKGDVEKRQPATKKRTNRRIKI